MSKTYAMLIQLKKYGKMTNSQLVATGGYRYGARIHNLREAGHIIVTNRVKEGLYEYTYKGKKVVA